MSAIYDFAASLWAAMRSDFEAELDRRFTAADNACNGYLLNKEGKAAGIDARSLFTGPVDRAYKYASRELIDHWTAHGRITMTHFEKEWVDTRGGVEAYA